MFPFGNIGWEVSGFLLQNYRDSLSTFRYHVITLISELWCWFELIVTKEIVLKRQPWSIWMRLRDWPKKACRICIYFPGSTACVLSIVMSSPRCIWNLWEGIWSSDQPQRIDLWPAQAKHKKGYHLHRSQIVSSDEERGKWYPKDQAVQLALSNQEVRDCLCLLAAGPLAKIHWWGQEDQTQISMLWVILPEMRRQWMTIRVMTMGNSSHRISGHRSIHGFHNFNISQSTISDCYDKSSGNLREDRLTIPSKCQTQYVLQASSWH